MKQMTARKTFFHHELTTPQIFHLLLQAVTYPAVISCP
jgi:hypothetical protein